MHHYANDKIIMMFVPSENFIFIEDVRILPGTTSGTRSDHSEQKCALSGSSTAAAAACASQKYALLLHQ